MRDTPIHVAALGADAAKREKRLHRLFSTLFKTATNQEPIGARDAGDRLVGVTGATPAGRCQPGGRQRLAMTSAIATFGPRAASRTLHWLDAWAARDLDEPHVHLGPFGVDRGLQRKGIGSAILERHVERLDTARSVGFLETDTPGNVKLYEAFGYEVVDRADVLGVPCFWMRRAPASAA